MIIKSQKDYNSVDWNEIFTEDPSSPSGLVWKIRSAMRIQVGDVAGSIKNVNKTDGKYFQVTYNKIHWYIHRILWVMRNGSIDTDLDIDHVDGNSLNNSPENLRLVSHAVNNRNRKQQKDNSSGVTGVYFKTYPSGNIYAVATWCDFTGKRKAKSFLCNNLGTEIAFRLACKYRVQMLAELNEVGAEYTERHGE